MPIYFLIPIKLLENNRKNTRCNEDYFVVWVVDLRERWLVVMSHTSHFCGFWPYSWNLFTATTPSFLLSSYWRQCVLKTANNDYNHRRERIIFMFPVILFLLPEAFKLWLNITLLMEATTSGWLNPQVWRIKADSTTLYLTSARAKVKK